MMTFWLKERLLKSVYDDIYRLQLLYEVDAETLTYVDPTPKASLLIPIGITATAGIAISSVNFLTDGSTSHAILIAVGVLNAGMAYCYFHYLTNIPRLLHSIIKDVKIMQKDIRGRERIFFGQGVNGSRIQASLRRKAAHLLRRFIAVLENSSKELSTYIPGEKDGLMSNYYTKEIVHLLEGDLDVVREILSDGAVATLVDILFLHISAFSRLLILYLVQPFSIQKLYLITKRTKSELIPLLNQLTDLIKQPKKYIVRQIQEAGASTLLADHEAAALVLDGISSNILSKSISPKEARVAIQKVLFMQWFRPIESKQQISLENTSVEVEDVFLPPKLVQTSIFDQVFEAVAEKEHQPTTYCDQEFNMERSAIASSLIGELRMILGDRSKEFDARERKALAVFYGITEEELSKREEESKKKQKENQLEATGEVADKVVERQQQKRIPLSSDLLQALSKRVPGKEDVIGDSSKDEIIQ